MNNVVKSWITSFVGVAIYIGTSILIWKGTFDFTWEGLVGYCLGTFLLLSPDNILKLVSTGVKNYFNKDKTSTPTQEEISNNNPNG